MLVQIYKCDFCKKDLGEDWRKVESLTLSVNKKVMVERDYCEDCVLLVLNNFDNIQKPTYE